MSEILKALGLRTHPFRPDEDANGQPFDDPEFLLKPLNPLRDPRLIAFYFDNYDYQGSIREISRQKIFENFPTQTDMENKGPAMVLISGSDRTGRESVRNLILQKIKMEFGAPLTVQVSLTSLNAAANLRTVATLFLYTYNRGEQAPTLAELKGPFDLQTAEANAALVESYSTLFQVWGQFVLAVCQRPLILLVEGVDNHDLWRTLFDSASYLFKFIIVLTKNEPHANAAYNAMAGKHRVLIKAQTLGPKRAKRYLAARLSAERIGPGAPPDDLMPFSEKALDALYEEGSRFKPGDQIQWSIGWLNETFRTVMDAHLAALNSRAQALEQHGSDISALSQDELLIGEDIVRAARKRINES